MCSEDRVLGEDWSSGSKGVCEGKWDKKLLVRN